MTPWTAPLSRLSGARDNRPRREVLSWAGWCALLTTFGEGVEKASLPAWSPGVYDEGGRRGLADVRAVSAVVLDYDDGTPIREGRVPWRSWPHIVHTSWSHTVDAPRWRLVLPLEAPIPASAWGRAWCWARARAVGEPDRACSDASRLYYLPAVRDEAHPREAWVWDEPSALLDLGDGSDLPPTPDELAALEARRRAEELRVSVRDDARTASERLKVDGDARRALAVELGAVIVEGGAARPRADRVRCPACGRDSVAWMLDPGASVRAWCSHRNSCGGTWFLDELAAALRG